MIFRPPGPGKHIVASVLQLISSLTVGGSERLLINFAASCAGSVQQVVFVVINDKINDQFASELVASGHPTYFLKRTPGERNPRIILNLLRIMRLHDVRLIHAHDSGAKHFAMLSKLYRSMSVGYTIHNTGIVASWDRVRLRLHQRFVDWNIAISGAVERECQNVNLQRIFKVHNGIPLASFCALDRPRKFRTPLRLINVARLYPRQKGQDILIKAVGICASRNLDVLCDFVGSPPEDDPRPSKSCSSSRRPNACRTAFVSSATGRTCKRCSMMPISSCCRPAMKALASPCSKPWPWACRRSPPISTGPPSF